MKKLIIIFSIFMVLGCSQAAQQQVDERPFVKKSDTNWLDEGDLCPTKIPARYDHHFVLIDATTPLTQNQINWINRSLFSTENLKQMAPYDRLTIMRLAAVAPASNKPLFSKCRPRNGDPSSIYKLDKHDIWTENQQALAGLYETQFIGGINEALDEIMNPQPLKNQPISNIGSPIMEQIKEIARLPDLQFSNKSGYKTRKFTIISDLAQNTERLPFYKLCPGNKKCPSWKKFKNNKKYKEWVDKIQPNFGDNINVFVMYLNSHFDTEINKGVVKFWEDFFKDNGLPNFEFEIETKSKSGTT